MGNIETNVKKILNEIPRDIIVVAAAKRKTIEEIEIVIKVGIKVIGENYLQEARKIIPNIKENCKYHFIGHLQKNKVKYVVPLFDMIETVDSVELAEKINGISEKQNKTMDILIEVNSGRESQKNGIFPERTKDLILQINELRHIRILGLMTMGPRFGNPEDSRKYFKITKKIFDDLKDSNIENCEMRYLSMGMSNSYAIAIEEGANIIRIGTKIFGKRDTK